MGGKQYANTMDYDKTEIKQLNIWKEKKERKSRVHSLIAL